MDAAAGNEMQKAAGASGGLLLMRSGVGGR
jgi:hypothetical protein